MFCATYTYTCNAWRNTVRLWHHVHFHRADYYTCCYRIVILMAAKPPLLLTIYIYFFSLSLFQTDHAYILLPHSSCHVKSNQKIQLARTLSYHTPSTLYCMIQLCRLYYHHHSSFFHPLEHHHNPHNNTNDPDVRLVYITYYVHFPLSLHLLVLYHITITLIHFHYV